MVLASVLDAIHGESDGSSDYEDDGYENEADDEEAGQLQSGFKAMDITTTTDGNVNLEGEGSLPEAADYSASIRELKALKNPKKKKKKGRKGDRRKQSVPPGQPIKIEHFVVQTCRRIEETKYPLFREAVDRIGIDAMKALLNQVDAIERCGGQMTADGLRRRSAGGVLWSLLRDHVGPGLYKEIMKEGNRKHIEQQKAKIKEREKERGNGNGKRQHMEVDVEGDERQNVKRRRTSVDFGDGPVGRSGRSVSRERGPRACLREEVDNVRAPAALQNAWIQGLKKRSERGDNGLNPKPCPAEPNPTGVKRPVGERIRMTVSYGDLVEEGEIATGSPIRGVTADRATGIEKRDCKGQRNAELDNGREEGEIAD